MDKSYRIHTNIAQDTLLQVNMQQDFDFLEVLSLKLRQKDAYRLHSSNYGVIIGRVLANDAFGIPNAKLSVFIERDSGDTSDMEYIYPYSEVTSQDKEGRRYNLLPDYSDDDCYRVVGTFPNKRLMLDDNIQLEVYDKYYKYTTVTNNAGDYMIFGVPTGSVTVHIDIDLSDIGVLSQKPYDFEYKGYNLTLFDSPVQFKESTNLDGLSQIFSQNRSVFVYPFWGDADNGIASITRADIQIQYKFEPTCVFMGSIVSDNEGHSIGNRCAPDIENGMNDQLIGGNGTIEMIRKTTDGLVEEYQIQGNQLIDENGVWCYQIPMNLDYIGTDEYGNIVPTDNPNKGIPTRAQVRFRISKNETSDEGFSRHTAKYLVPMNPVFSEQEYNYVDLKDSEGGLNAKLSGEIPVIPDKGSDIEKMYVFGSSTPINCFRDLYWNNVYSVKNYIPKTQVAHRAYSKNYCALKGSNLAEDQNPIPFNKLRIDLPFLYMIVCLIFTMIVYIVAFINLFIICTINLILDLFWSIKEIEILGFKPFDILPVPKPIGCIALSAGVSEGNVGYYPGCECESGMDASDCPDDMEGECTKSKNIGELLDKIQRNLALEFKIIKLDLYQDWINGCLYMPLWYWRKRKKKTFLFGLFTLSRAKNDYCSDNDWFSRLKTAVTCNIKYTSRSLEVSNNRESMPDSEDRWHKNRSNQVRYQRGLIKPVENKDGLTAYYYVAVQASDENYEDRAQMIQRKRNFKAVRLFATDIILLGNLNPKNIYGIPQFFTCLPSTTANIPPIATIEENLDPNQKEEVLDKDISGSEDSGTTIVTGMDWNHDGDDDTPVYKKGLFMDLACTYAATRPKSCINVERLSELGVTLDMEHKIPYHNGGTDIVYGKIDSDGFITKYELDDMENRAMFATLNHIGFIPQEYQDAHNYYTTQVHDKNTNYLIPKFKYIYPVDFDGRMQLPMNLYKNGFEQAMFDERDESYLTFRLGAEASIKYTENSEGRIRHFYNIYEDGLRDMPLYNNSYYFYFGIKKGSTAIDKFNKMFYASCTKNVKMPFTLDIEAKGRSYCPEVYTPTPGTCPDETHTVPYGDNENKSHAYGYIRVTSDDIRTPYSYTLYDAVNDVVISESGMTTESFVIGGVINSSGDAISNCEGRIVYQIPSKINGEKINKRIDSDVMPYYASGITNQEYILEVTDADGRKISEKIKVEVPKISGEYKATRLGAKFYNSATTRIDYICNDDNAFYGKIEMLGFTVDGYNCEIKDIEYLGYVAEDGDDTNGRYTFCITGSSKEISDNVIAYLELMVLKSTKENLVRNCLCDNDGSVNLIKAKQDQEKRVKMKIAAPNGGDLKNEFFLATDPGADPSVDKLKVIWYIYQPNRYVMRITQGCPDCSNPIIENSSTEIINILNGEPFITRLNTMPTKFMLGTVNDNLNADIASTSYFYNVMAATSTTENPNDATAAQAYHLKGWYGTHEEESYMFSKREENKTYNYNQHVWEDVIKNLHDSVASPGMKRTILKMKFDSMFALSEGTYITNDSSCKFTFKSTGGISPILYRSAAPTYSEPSKMFNTYVLNDFFSTVCLKEFPNIVADNYSVPLKNAHNYNPYHFNPSGPHFNGEDEGKEATYSAARLLGNYFAAFTRDGSYISKNKIDGINIVIERSPSFASISPIRDNILKTKGKDEFGRIGYFSLVHTKGEQTLQNDVKRDTLPYLRAIYVDRRFDFDLTVLAPIMSKNFSLYVDENRNRPWKSGRISGWTYNGIEMAYDEEYNVISADVKSVPTITYNNTGEEPGVEDVEYTAATFNKRLEYTYKYDCADICLTCGHQQKDMGAVCPICGHNNINYFHGEIGTEKVVDSHGHITCELTTHTQDTDNFNSGDKIPGVITEGNEKHYSLDDAITYYHKFIGGRADNGWTPEKYEVQSVNEYRWGKWNTISMVQLNGAVEKFGYESGYDSEESMTPLIKEFYSSSIAGLDIRHLYWSLFNYERLKYYTTKGGIPQQDGGYGPAALDNPVNPCYVYNYPYKHNPSEVWYNGDFNREHVVNGCPPPYSPKKPYPTKRFLDIGNLPVLSRYTYGTQCCSYEMASVKGDDGTLRAETKAGESFEINFDWINPITLIAPNADSKEYANITYLPKKPDEKDPCGPCGCEPFPFCVKFTASTASMAFRYNLYKCDNFEVYTRTPRIIQVLPYIEYGCGNARNIDGIGFYKTSNPDTTEFNGKYGDGISLTEALNVITLDEGYFEKDTINIWELISNNDRRNVYLPENVSLGGASEYTTKYGTSVDGATSFFKKDGKWLQSNDDDFANIVFKKDLSNLLNSDTCQNALVFTVLAEREYRYKSDDNLIRHIRTVETSDLYDCRDLFMRITVVDDTSAGEGPLSYVQMRKENATPITGLTGINTSTTAITAGTEVVDGVTGETGTIGEDTTKIFVQTLTYDLFFKTDPSIPMDKRQNEAFADFSMMSYVFRYYNIYDDQFDVSPSDVHIIDEGDVKILRLIVRWPTNMGILADKQWTGEEMKRAVPTELYARTPSNFIYKLTEFKTMFCCVCGGGGQEPGECGDAQDSKDEMKENEKYLTHAMMTNDCRCTCQG